MSTRFVSEPAALIGGPGAYLLSKLLKEPPVAAFIRDARWLHGPDFDLAVAAVHAAGRAWQATVDLPRRGNAVRFERSAADCTTMNPMSTKQAAEHLDLGIRQVQELAKSGRITGRRVAGRWQLDPSAVRAYHQQKRAPAA